MHDLKPGDPATIGRYRLVGRLGSGGMGVVYLGRSPGGRVVAVKVVHAHLLDRDPSFRSRFRREIEAAKRVGGFYTAAVVDGDADAPSPWYASAFIDAPTLTDVVRNDGPLGEARARELGAGLAEALAAVHEAGLVHRDLERARQLRVRAFGAQAAPRGVAALAKTPGLRCGRRLARNHLDTESRTNPQLPDPPSRPTCWSRQTDHGSSTSASPASPTCPGIRSRSHRPA
ncbi:protein kinase domain-containing protein [Pseudonocardia sp. CA-107938]|uniref:protein kinase domain-containing protein n=1 Tax=Pseudonocardia sp. CA-107938 TaxID=3240021 RepID=UPI003D932568